jgi:hypothetical protein
MLKLLQTVCLYLYNKPQRLYVVHFQTFKYVRVVACDGQILTYIVIVRKRDESPPSYKM